MSETELTRQLAIIATTWGPKLRDLRRELNSLRQKQPRDAAVINNKTAELDVARQEYLNEVQRLGAAQTELSDIAVRARALKATGKKLADVADAFEKWAPIAKAAAELGQTLDDLISLG